MAYNMALHRAAMMVQWVSYRLFELCDDDGTTVLSLSDVSDLADALEVPEDFEDFEMDDLVALAEACDPDCYVITDIDDSDCTVYITCPERVTELEAEAEAERTYHADIDAAYRAATGF